MFRTFVFKWVSEEQCCLEEIINKHRFNKHKLQFNQVFEIMIPFHSLGMHMYHII